MSTSAAVASTVTADIDLKPLKRLQKPWAGMLAVVNFLIWVNFLPWRIFKALSPSFLQKYEEQAGDFLFNRIGLPITLYAKNTLHWFVDWTDHVADAMLCWATDVCNYCYNTTVALGKMVYDKMESKAQSVEHLGWGGIFSTYTPPAAAMTSTVQKAKPY